MVKFKEGDRIRCINSDAFCIVLTKGKVYTVIRMSKRIRYNEELEYVRLVADDGMVHHFYAERFELELKYMRVEKLKKIGLL